MLEVVGYWFCVCAESISMHFTNYKALQLRLKNESSVTCNVPVVYSIWEAAVVMRMRQRGQYLDVMSSDRVRNMG